MPNTREKLIELLKESGVAFPISTANFLIANGVTLDNQVSSSKWIPVTERLPDTAERVLVCKTWLGTVYKPVYGYYQDYPNQKGCWYVLTEFGYYPQREVTHWMPLPKPPKGE